MGKKNKNKKQDGADTQAEAQILTEAPVVSKSGSDLLRDANTGVFYRGTKPACSPTGTNAGEDFWEIR